ncbi:helix-turn-helix domain-containing protein [Actinomadura keratinilytica]
MSRYARTHETLRTAALEMFAAQGYDATTTAAVAERAGVSEMTLFRHFATKEALLLEDAFDPAVAAAVRARPPQEHPMRAAAEGIRTVWRQLPEDQLESVRERIRIIAAPRGCTAQSSGTAGPPSTPSSARCANAAPRGPRPGSWRAPSSPD